MATKANITILNHDPIGLISIKVASGTVIATGDLIDFDGTDAAVHGDTGNQTIVGVAMVGSESGSIKDIEVATRAMLSAKIKSGGSAGVLGDGYKYNAGANGTDWDFDKVSTGGIMWVAQNNIAAGEFGNFALETHALTGGILFDNLTTSGS